MRMFFESTTYQFATDNKYNIVNTMWVLQIKRDKITGEIDKYKARLVALGNQQKHGSYTDINSNTVRSNSVKLMLALMAQTDSEAMVIDIKGAYLKSEIDKQKNGKLSAQLRNGDYMILKKN